VGLRAGVEALEKRKLLPLSGIETRFLGHAARSLVTTPIIQISATFSTTEELKRGHFGK
jgi:hypothetical protein